AHRFGAARDVPARAEAVRVHGPVPLEPGRVRLDEQRVRRLQERLVERDRLAEVGQVPAHQASRAQRKPAKICRRMGKSQLRNVVRIATGSVAQEPPRSTLYSSPKNTSEYSRYGNTQNPGWPVKSVAVHSQTSPRSCRTPYAGAPSGNEPTGVGR